MSPHRILTAILRRLPHPHGPRRAYTPLGWGFICDWCGHAALTEPEFYGGSNSDGYVDLRRRRVW